MTYFRALFLDRDQRIKFGEDLECPSVLEARERAQTALYQGDYAAVEIWMGEQRLIRFTRSAAPVPLAYSRAVGAGRTDIVAGPLLPIEPCS